MYSVQLYVEIKYKYDKQCEIRVKTSDNIKECVETNMIGRYLMYFSCVWGCYVPHIWQIVTTASRKEEKRSRQEATEYFHLGAYGTSTKPVVITMSTIAGVHFIGYTCFWRSLATELRGKLLQSSYLIWNSIMFCWEKETHPDCGLVTA